MQVKPAPGTGPSFGMQCGCLHFISLWDVNNFLLFSFLPAVNYDSSQHLFLLLPCQ